MVKSYIMCVPYGTLKSGHQVTTAILARLSEDDYRRVWDSAYLAIKQHMGTADGFWVCLGAISEIWLEYSEFDP
jgi:hypothetical protein